MIIGERSDQLAVPVLAANYSTNGYPSRIPTTTQPTGAGVLPVTGPGIEVSKALKLIPFGTGTATNTFSLKVLGWAVTSGSYGSSPSVGQLPLWVPVVLGTYQATLGTGAGVAGSDLGTTQLFATTITQSYGPTFVTAGPAPITPDRFILSPGSNAIGMISQRTFGFPLLEVIFTTGGSATDCNALWARM